MCNLNFLETPFKNVKKNDEINFNITFYLTQYAQHIIM